MTIKNARDARKVCLLVSMALSQEAEMKARGVDVPSHLVMDQAKLAKLLRHVTAWIEREHSLEKFVSTLLEGESALVALENDMEVL
jgi:hypothetical protein